MVDPFLKYKNINFTSVFEGYIEATVDNSRIKSRFISYEDHVLNQTWGKRYLASELDQETLFAPELDHFIVINNSADSPGFINMQLEFTDINKVSLERQADYFNVKIIRPELFYPNFEKMSKDEIKNILPIKL